MQDIYGFITMVIIVVASMYFVKLPKGKKYKYKSMTEMRCNLKAGDSVVTVDGILGCITGELGDGDLLFKYANNKELVIARSGVSRLVDFDEAGGKIITLRYEDK